MWWDWHLDCGRDRKVYIVSDRFQEHHTVLVWARDDYLQHMGRFRCSYNASFPRWPIACKSTKILCWIFLSFLYLIPGSITLETSILALSSLWSRLCNSSKKARVTSQFEIVEDWPDECDRTHCSFNSTSLSSSSMQTISRSQEEIVWHCTHVEKEPPSSRWSCFWDNNPK